MKQEDAMALLSILVSTVAGLLGHRAAEGDKRVRSREEHTIIDSFTREVQPEEARVWYRKILPPGAPRVTKGGRLWVHHPVRINTKLYLSTSTSLDGLYVIGEDRMIGFLAWDEIEDIIISLDVVN